MIALLGSLASLLSALIAGSSQSLIVPLNTLEATSGVSTRVSMPGRLYAIAIGPTTIGMFQASLPPQRSLAAATSPSSSLSAESEPAKSTWPLLNCSTPAPEPVGL